MQVPGGTLLSRKFANCHAQKSGTHTPTPHSHCVSHTFTLHTHIRTLKAARGKPSPFLLRSHSSTFALTLSPPRTVTFPGRSVLLGGGVPFGRSSCGSA